MHGIGLELCNKAAQEKKKCKMKLFFQGIFIPFVPAGSIMFLIRTQYL